MVMGEPLKHTSLRREESDPAMMALLKKSCVSRKELAPPIQKVVPGYRVDPGPVDSKLESCTGVLCHVNRSPGNDGEKWDRRRQEVTGRRIEAAETSLGYNPNSLAKRLLKSRSRRGKANPSLATVGSPSDHLFEMN